MRSRFDEQLVTLNEELTKMGAMCEKVIYIAAKALVTGDIDLAKSIIPIDNEIDQKERDIESLGLKILLQQQPVASDLRQISAALKMITDMERIGDQAADISEIIGFINGRVDKDCKVINLMAEATMKMVTESVEAFVKRDINLARLSIEHDDIVDNYFKEVKESLIKVISENPDDGEYALDLLMIAKYFERIGDHATNIAEWVVFSVTGTHEGEQNDMVC